MKLTLGSFLIGLLIVAILAAGGFYAYTRLQETHIVSLEDSIANLQAEVVPLRFMILSRQADSLTVRIRFYNLAGEEFGMLETTLPGHELFVDFLAAPYRDSWLAFPVLLFTESIAPANGIELKTIVAPNGQPLTYSGGAFGEAALGQLAEVYQALLSGQPVKGAFGNAVHDIAELETFSPGLVYKAVIRTKGGIEIIEDN
ncbi:MAG: hypothetical protein A2087_12065 [Spirochaetes bacterium GWD1_61_31]|nr:MAG: hypothetical protein A2Y37_00850 [Spirochaetes bacterium GWB1_60_80]OHD34556.1 MAG: hypothetical protein A2004_11665 [Spirochaetes bacterium GWC1_61_12]OHD41421.1 MAG: hypothetical protein A2087_12065 [Spirochaetes bacterium GWD1_61_31]OHD45204.1 MAG: hypothetical protein A2Y35_13775 [Spirochaetes bacterium GWE1_60_18]OHD60705.1 MAG: hypothetical protein A2Y32_07480 [Spirochaetes bacterium GWF1_60_12]HAP43909.1 hypothetical protein [Spirochaetaceae bacterium]